MMRRKPIMALCAVMVSVALIGCETAGQSAGAGALVGGLAGGIIGHQSGHAAEGALIGAAVGGLAGWGIHKYKTKQVKDREQARQEYEYEPEQGFKLDIRESTVTPSRVKSGDKVTADLEYATLGTDGGVQVEEKRVLMRGNEEIATLDEAAEQRDDGVWRNQLEFKVPKDVEPGTYTLAQSVRARDTTEQRAASFDVSTQSAQVDVERTVLLTMVITE